MPNPQILAASEAMPAANIVHAVDEIDKVRGLIAAATATATTIDQGDPIVDVLHVAEDKLTGARDALNEYRGSSTAPAAAEAMPTVAPSKLEFPEYDAFERLYAAWLQARTRAHDPSRDDSDEAANARTDEIDRSARELLSAPVPAKWK